MYRAHDRSVFLVLPDEIPVHASTLSSRSILIHYFPRNYHRPCRKTATIYPECQASFNVDRDRDLQHEHPQFLLTIHLIEFRNTIGAGTKSPGLFSKRKRLADQIMRGISFYDRADTKMRVGDRSQSKFKNYYTSPTWKTWLLFFLTKINRFAHSFVARFGPFPRVLIPRRPIQKYIYIFAQD